MHSNSLNFAKNLFLLIKLFTLINKIKPELLISFTIKPNLYGSLISKFFKIPIIINMTGLGTVFLDDHQLFDETVFLGSRFLIQGQ